MVRGMLFVVTVLAGVIQSAAPAAAQFYPQPGPPVMAPGPGFGPPPPNTVIQQQSPWGPICFGYAEAGFGNAPCETVRQEMQIRARMPAIFPQLQVLGPGPFGPICASPMGPAPCFQVARSIAMQQVAQQQLPPMTQIGDVAGVGPICAGPLGPGPCEAVRLYLMQAIVGAGLSQPLDLRNMRAQGSSGQGPICDGPGGRMPCALVGQIGLDQIGAASIPSRSSFGLPQTGDTRRLAQDCARQAGLDLAAFAGCTGKQMVLTGRQQEMLNCATENRDPQAFASCAAEATGIRLPEEQRVLANCAVRAKGDTTRFAGCAGGAFVDRALTPDQKAVMACAARPGVTAESFVTCAAPRFLNEQQKAVLDCAVDSGDAESFTLCAAPNAGVKMSEDQRVVAKCALSSDGDASAFAACAGSSFLQRELGPREQAVLGCATTANGDQSKFAGCAANSLLGKDLSREQQVALRCAVESDGDPASFGGCAAANMISLQLNPEQQIAVQCVVSTGGQPYAAAGCMASRLTLRELTKCMTDGVGGDGCFGDNNDLVGKNGFIGRNLRQLAGGPNSVINNPDQIWGGDNSFVRNPGQVFGGSNSFMRNPGQIFGGRNSVFNNPGQLMNTPKPLNLGTVGGKRICLPWC